MPSNPRGLFRAALTRLAPDPPADSDAELLGRYVAARDQDAFAAIVHRHGPMVHTVCRRRLGPGPDADDAFQVAFMVLARDAAKVARRESLPGWLYRVAYLVALKLAGRNARREADPLMDHDAADPADPQAEATAKELKDALDQELAALPDRLRAVVVLCGLEERTNAEAAKLLGCPVGTVDSRLSAARRALKARLARRGLAVTGGATLEALLRPGPAVALTELIDRTARAAVAYAAAGGAAADPLSSIADGVTPTMGTAKLKLWVAAGMSLALFGTAGLGLYRAPAGQEKPKSSLPAEKAEPAKKGEAKPAGGLEAEAGPPALKDEAAVRAALQRPVQLEVDGISLRELLDLLYVRYGVVARIDMAAYQRAGGPPDFRPYEAKITLPVTRGMSVADMLTDALAQIETGGGGGVAGFTFTYRVRGNQVLIVPAYQPPVLPGSGAHSEPGSIQPLVDSRRLLEQIVGPPVSLAIEDKPLTAAVQELRKLTGANIVIDARCRDSARQAVSATFDDVRLLTALQILADMCELRPVALNNVYYITTPENAARLQREVNRDLFGEPPVPTPPAAPAPQPDKKSVKPTPPPEKK